MKRKSANWKSRKLHLKNKSVINKLDVSESQMKKHFGEESNESNSSVGGEKLASNSEVFNQVKKQAIKSKLTSEDQNNLNHKKYNSKNSFVVELDFLFEDDELILLKKHGEWYKALYEGKIKPINENQKIFTKKSSDSTPLNKHHSVWRKYLSVQDSWGEISKILNASSKDDLIILADILECSYVNSKEILKSLIKKSKNIVDDIIDDKQYSYTDVLTKVAHQLKIPKDNNVSFRDRLKDNEWLDFKNGLLGSALMSVSNLAIASLAHHSAKSSAYSETSNKDLERKITLTVFKERYEKLSVSEKRDFDREIVALAKENGDTIMKVGSVIGKLTAANLSGFGVYVLATSTLSAISGAIGLTLPFAAYTGLSSVISTFIGPVGWAATGLYAVYKLNDVNYKRIIPAIIYINWLREKTRKS
jgi:uncharacterized protein YaaW (UPF0174 family)/uncharacterized protein YifE (UPF0438 family)